MKLHDLQVSQRFSFIGKHQGKTFEVTEASNYRITFRDVATGELRDAFSNRKTFRMEVILDVPDKMVSLESIVDMVHDAYLSERTEAGRSAINKLYLKLTGLPGRRVVLPEGE